MALAGTPVQRSKCPKTSHCCPYHPTHRSSIRSRTSGSTCAAATWRSASTIPTTPSSMPAARPGAASLLSQTASHPSRNANGQSYHDLWRLVSEQVTHPPGSRIGGYRKKTWVAPLGLVLHATDVLDTFYEKYI